MFCKHHYVIVARIIRQSEDKLDLIANFIALFKADNNKFDSELFRIACMDEMYKAREAKSNKKGGENIC